MAGLASLLCLAFAASVTADESSLIQWDSQDADQGALESVLTRQDVIGKASELTKLTEENTRKAISKSLKFLRSEADVRKEQARIKKSYAEHSWAREAVQAALETEEWAKNVNQMKNTFALTNYSDLSNAKSKTQPIADRVLRSLEGAVSSAMAQAGPVRVALEKINLGVEWGARTACPHNNGFSVNFQYHREHKAKDKQLVYSGAGWHHRFGHIFEDGLEVYAQQNFAVEKNSQMSGLWLVLPWEPGTPPVQECTSKKLNFHIGAWIRLPNVVRQIHAFDLDYHLVSTPEFYWVWNFDGTTDEPEPEGPKIGAFVEFDGSRRPLGLQDVYSFFFGDGFLLMQYQINTNL